jgi:GGDEF domain-containing protein
METMPFDRAELDQLERRELHLTILAVLAVLVLAAGDALLMYPLVFVHPTEGNPWGMRVAFVGFCALVVLFAGYLLDRQRTVGRLKQGLLEELERNVKLRDQGNTDLLQSLPGLQRFQDCLAMEVRRAASSEKALTLFVVKVTLSRGGPGSNEGRAALGEAARAITRQLRPTDSVYLFGPGLFGIVLPDTDSAGAKKVSSRLEESLRFVGTGNLFKFEVLLYNYPEDVHSAHELEKAVSSLLPETESWELAADTP